MNTSAALEIPRLPGDLLLLADDVQEQFRRPAVEALLRDIDEVVLVGSGDSLHAALASTLGFHLAGISARAISVTPFHTYAAAWMRPMTRRLVVVISVSGATPGAIVAAERARELGQNVLAVVGDASSPLAAMANISVVQRLPERMPGPGIRTYQGSLAILTLLVGHLADAATEDQVVRNVRQASADLGQTLEPLAAAVERLRLPHEPMIVLGTGPQLGTAMHTAAKIVEMTGIFAVGRELEEWWHVERMADPADMTTLVILTPDSAQRATEIIRAARLRGRRVVCVGPPELISTDEEPGLPVLTGLPEEMSPLVYQVVAATLAVDLAKRAGVLPFSGGIVS